MKRDPISKQRSPWIEDTSMGGEIEGKYPFRWFRRRTGDGLLWACVAIEPGIGWHMSMSFRDNKGQFSRYPTWDEIAHAREQLLPDELGFVMHLPPLTTDEYVALHKTTFHLHQEPAPEGDL